MYLMSSYFINRICIQKRAGQVDLWVSGEPSTHLHPPSLPGSLSPIQTALLNFPAKSWKIDKNTRSHHRWGSGCTQAGPDAAPLRWLRLRQPAPLCCWWWSDLHPSAGKSLCWGSTSSPQGKCNTSCSGNGTILVGNRDLLWLTS